MSDHTVMRRRLAALDEAVALLTREWGETCEAGPVAHYSDQASAKLVDEDGNEAWATVALAAKALGEIRETVAEITRQAEADAARYGPMVWT